MLGVVGGSLGEWMDGEIKRSVGEGSAAEFVLKSLLEFVF